MQHNNETDALARLAAESEQHEEQTRAVARQTAVFYHELIREEMPEALAEELVVEFLSNILPCHHCGE